MEDETNEIMNKECELYHYHQRHLEEQAQENVVATNKEGEQ